MTGSKTTHQMAQPGGAGHILEESMSDAGKSTPSGPLAARGGVLAPADKNILKTVLMFYINERGDQMDATEAMQLVNLLHRVNRLR